jgi:O-antigen/teichoic acid export membrane protein
MTESQANQTKLVAIEAGGTGAAQIIGAGLRYISILFTTRILGASAYGAYTLALTVTGIVNVISVLGLSPGVLPFLSKARKRGDDRAIAAVIRAALGLVLAASLVCLAGVILAAPWLASAVFQKPAVGTFLKALSALVILGALLSMVLTLIQGFMAVKERAWIERVAAVGVTTTVDDNAFAKFDRLKSKVEQAEAEAEAMAELRGIEAGGSADDIADISDDISDGELDVAAELAELKRRVQ